MPYESPRSDLRAMKEAVVEGRRVFTASFGGRLHNNSIVFVLDLVAPPVVVGCFAAADRRPKALRSLIYPISQAAYSHIAVLLERSQEKAFTFVGKLLRLFVACTLLLTVVLCFGADRIANLAFEVQYASSAAIIRLLSPWPLLIALNVIFGALFIAQLNLGQLLSASILSPVLIHIMLLYPVPHFTGAEALAVLMPVTELSVFLIRFSGTGRTHWQDLSFTSSGILETRA